MKKAETFLSQWSRSNRPFPVRHGEKSSRHPDRIPEELQQLLHVERLTSLELEKRRLISEEYEIDPVFVCVDPYDVNPLYASKPEMRERESRAAPAHKIKLEMEEFGDLSPFVRTRRASVNSVDELVTPIFDKDAFDFGTNTATTASIFLNSDNTDKPEQQQQQLQQQQYQQQQLEVNEETFVKLERELLSSACSFAKRDNPDRRQQETTTTTTTTNNNVHIINNNTNNIINNSSSNAALFFASYADVTNNINNNNNNNNAFSNSNGNRGKLSLNVNVRNVAGFDLTTPSIIEEVVDLEAATNGGFDLFDLIGKEDPESILDLAVLPAPLPPSAPDLPNREPPTRKRRRRPDQSEDEDDDDDYAPPTPKTPKKTARRTRKTEQPLSESEPESECSAESSSKYRELRDKNNEASRKSRLKRKLRELELETEAEELGSRNVKLRAQVGELERLVTNFRENLFKMMMAKK